MSSLAAVASPPPPSALILAVLVAAPFYWLGFVADRMIWLLPGVLAVLVARFLVPAQQAASAAEAAPARVV